MFPRHGALDCQRRRGVGQSQKSSTRPDFDSVAPASGDTSSVCYVVVGVDLNDDVVLYVDIDD